MSKRISQASWRPTASGVSIAKRICSDGVPVDKIFSETDEQVMSLVETQTDCDVSIESVRDRFKTFTEPAMYRKSLSEVSGVRTQSEYAQHEQNQEIKQSLRDSNVTEEELDFWIKHRHPTTRTSKTDCQPSNPCRANPEMIDLRLEDVERRIQQHKDLVNQAIGFTAAQTVSRHKLELEAALNQGREEQRKLSALVLKGAASTESSVNLIKTVESELMNKKIPIPDYGAAYPNPWVPVKSPVEKTPVEPGFIGPKIKDPDLHVSDRYIFTNRFTEGEIKKIPKFSSYTPGDPYKVLYVKNLASTVKQEHLEHLFSRYHIPGDAEITCRLMSGRMRGQAFISCADVETASRCLHSLNGYILRDRPMIISYSQPRKDNSQNASTPATVFDTGLNGADSQNLKNPSNQAM